LDSRKPKWNEYIQAEAPISSIEIVNLLGQTLLISKGNSRKEQVDISGLSAGNYFVKVFVGDASRVLRIVKNKIHLEVPTRPA